MTGRGTTDLHLKKRLLGVFLPILLVAVSVCLGFILTGFATGQRGSAKNQPETFFSEALSAERNVAFAEQGGGTHGEPAFYAQAEGWALRENASAVLFAEVDPVEQLLSTPSPYETTLSDAPKGRRESSARGKGSVKSAVAQQKADQKSQLPAQSTGVSSLAAESAAKDSFLAGQEALAEGETEEKPAERESTAPKAEKGLSEGKTGQTQKAATQPHNEQPAGAKSKETPVHLFNTVALFPKPVSAKTAPQWHRVVQTQKTPPPIFSNGTAKRMPPNVAKRWFALREKIEGADDFAKAKAVNTFFNTWPYRTDDVVWGVPEYWATPEEFLEKSGDCEDYAITKYYALRSLGVSADKLRVVAVKDTVRGIGHAVLAFFHNNTAYVLDNLSPYALEHTVLKNYRPQFSVNEHYRWGHARIVKKK